MREFSRWVSLIRMLSLSARAGMSQKMRPSASRAFSLSSSPWKTWPPCSNCFLCSSLFFFLSLSLLSPSSSSFRSSSVCGARRFTGADFPVFESRATKVKLAVNAIESESSSVSAREGRLRATLHGTEERRGWFSCSSPMGTPLQSFFSVPCDSWVTSIRSSIEDRPTHVTAPAIFKSESTRRGFFKIILSTEAVTSSRGLVVLSLLEQC